MTSVFDVASAVLQRSPKDSLSTLKLQKLVFYSFGWYGHLTNNRLFNEEFFAMPKGPIVSPLLSAHANMTTVSLDFLQDRLGQRLELDDAYANAVVDAVCDSYGRHNEWDLIEMTHLEKPWLDAWNDRPREARRGALGSDVVVDYFVRKNSAVYEIPARSVYKVPTKTVHVPVLSFLPDRTFTALSIDSLRSMENSESDVPATHARSARELRRRFLTIA